MPALKKTTLVLFIAILFSIPVLAQDNLALLSQRFSREIPVQLFEGQEGKIGVRGEAVLECYRGVKLSEVYYFSSPVTIRFEENGLAVDDEDGNITIGLAEVRCKPRQESSLMTFNNRAYRGYLKAIYEDDPQGMLLVNVIDIEDYLKGVLPGEIGDRAPNEYEAVKAQAIAARTYAVWKLTDRATSGKLAPTVADQLYTGYDTEKEFLSNGIDDTEGEIMTFKDLPISAFYHAVCGGHTSAVEKIWPEKKPSPYLEGADDKDYCAWAKSYSWAETFDLPKLREALEKYFVGRGEAAESDFADILDISFTSSPVTGRMEMMEVTTTAGVFKERCDRIRWALGRPSVPGAILPSTNFRAEKEAVDDTLKGLKIFGTGNGHGVGMCQCGAIGQSRLGHQHEDILKHYYKHIKIAKLY